MMKKRSIIDRLSDVADCTLTYWALRLSDCFGWSLLANHTIRPALLKFFGLQIGKHCHISTGLSIHSRKHRVKIGDHTTINKNCLFDAPLSPIEVGNYCSIGFNVSLINADHQHQIDAHGRRALSTTEPIVLEDYVWLGSNVLILPGVKIGKGSIIGAGAVVSKDIPPYSLAVGVPAKVVKTINSGETNVNNLSDEVLI